MSNRLYIIFVKIVESLDISVIVQYYSNFSTFLFLGIGFRNIYLLHILLYYTVLHYPILSKAIRNLPFRLSILVDLLRLNSLFANLISSIMMFLYHPELFSVFSFKNYWSNFVFLKYGSITSCALLL